MDRRARGFTLVEVLVASVVATVAAGGVMAAYLAAARMPRVQGQGSEDTVEANQLAAQTLEWMRNRVATDSTFFPDQAVLGWQDDAPTVSATTESIFTLPPVTRRYCVWEADCDGDRNPGDCYAAQVRVCWNGTACPSLGAPCS